MIKGMLGDDSMSNLTSASNEASISSTNNRIEIGSHVLYPQLQNIQTQPPPNKKKRNLPGNPGNYILLITRRRTVEISRVNYMLFLHHNLFYMSFKYF